MKVFFQWDTFITPAVIKVLYYIINVLALLGCVFGLVTSLMAGDYFTALGCIIAAVLAPIIIRVYAELLIIWFKILEAVKK